MIFTSERHETIFGWSRTVAIDGQEFSVSVQRGRSVWIPFKPRGQNRGWHWHGTVYRLGQNTVRVWTGRVPGSIGCRGLLKEAGVINPLPKKGCDWRCHEREVRDGD